MAKFSCPDVSSNGNSYSSPVLVIGLYIAAATMVCFVLMLCDVINSIRRKKSWIPCSFFSLNSATLTLLSIAAKLPVDLTSAMPSKEDQLSKLTGTGMVCVSLGFLLPSLGTNGASEGLTNMVALSIFVVTIIVNICIQMSTGVIFSFIIEHAIIMFCMSSSIIFMWLCTWDTNMQKENLVDRVKSILTMDTKTMLRLMKLCFLHGYNAEPQFIICKDESVSVAVYSPLFCTVVVLQATIRSLIGHATKSCTGHSDYGGSMKFIVVAQIMVILLASLVIGFRCHVIFEDSPDYVPSVVQETFDVIMSNPPLLKVDVGDQSYHQIRRVTDIVCTVLTYVFRPLTVILEATYKLSLFTINSCSCFNLEYTESKGIEDYKSLLLQEGMTVMPWTLKKCVEDIEKWISISEKSNSPNLKELFSKTPPSQCYLEQFKDGNEVSCLYPVFLVRIFSVFAPSFRSDQLSQSLVEVFDVIQFVDTKMNPSNPTNRKKRMLAKAMWFGDDLSSALPQSPDNSTKETRQSQSNVDRALDETISDLERVLPSMLWDEVVGIVAFIKGQNSKSIEELYHHIEQLFVDMLHILLAQLPGAIFKDLTECHAEEYEDRVRLMMQFLCQVKHLEDKVRWIFPAGSNITRLITTTPANDSHSGDLVIEVEI